MGFFGMFASLFIFIAGIVMIFKNDRQTGLYLILLSSLFYLGYGAVLCGTRIDRLLTAFAKAMTNPETNKSFVDILKFLKTPINKEGNLNED